MLKVAYIDTEGKMPNLLRTHSKEGCAGTFRPDRIKAIAERFGVNGEMALENILYGMCLPVSACII